MNFSHPQVPVGISASGPDFPAFFGKVPTKEVVDHHRASRC